VRGMATVLSCPLTVKVLLCLLARAHSHARATTSCPAAPPRHSWSFSVLTPGAHNRSERARTRRRPTPTSSFRSWPSAAPPLSRYAPARLLGSRLFADTGVVQLHGRSRLQRYSREADWSYIRQCAETSPIPIIGIVHTHTHTHDTHRHSS
jgi:hypothetical protein